MLGLNHVFVLSCRDDSVMIFTHAQEPRSKLTARFLNQDMEDQFSQVYRANAVNYFRRSYILMYVIFTIYIIVLGATGESTFISYSAAWVSNKHMLSVTLSIS